MAVPRRSRGQVLSWTAMILAIGLSVLMGLSVYGALSSLDVTSLRSLGRVSDWLTVPIVALVALVATLVMAVIALFRARPRLVATLAVLLTLVLPVVAVLVGVKLGASALVAHASEAATRAGSDVPGYVLAMLAEQGVDVGPLRSLIEWVLR